MNSELHFPSIGQKARYLFVYIYVFAFYECPSGPEGFAVRYVEASGDHDAGSYFHQRIKLAF